MNRISALCAKVRARAGRLYFSSFSVLLHLFDGHACSIAEAEAGEGFLRGLKRLVGLAEGKSHVVACHKKARFLFQRGTRQKKNASSISSKKFPNASSIQTGSHT
jgi:hypothetical protein